MLLLPSDSLANARNGKSHLREPTCRGLVHLHKCLKKPHQQTMAQTLANATHGVNNGEVQTRVKGGYAPETTFQLLWTASTAWTTGRSSFRIFTLFCITSVPSVCFCPAGLDFLRWHLRVRPLAQNAPNLPSLAKTDRLSRHLFAPVSLDLDLLLSPPTRCLPGCSHLPLFSIMRWPLSTRSVQLHVYTLPRRDSVSPVTLPWDTTPNHMSKDVTVTLRKWPANIQV
ncbi:hypothetical protein B0T17DRAFT_9134 [Bombardia bombarda]|uniref:Uncharacterized protein n=1 Tax=Bombardia bombarda TaxID=252184 RepID=A0AA39XIC0_9PEZI|nr:hypothetical protein B0T17DRAFT_9134 [Bombardia bombarda]